jgi:hypothetical protein
MGDDDNKTAFSEDQVASLRTLVSGIVNSAISARDKMVDKKRAEDRDGLKADVAKLLDEKFASLKPADPAPSDKDGKRSKGEDLEAATTRKQLAELRELVEKANSRAAAERAKNEANELRERIGKMLAPTGIDGTRFRGAYAVLKDRIRKQSDEDDAPYVFVDDSGEEIDLEIGVKGWTKSDEAKIYTPPTGAAGSGARRVASPLTQAKDGKSKETTYEDVGNMVLGLMGGTKLGE